VTHTVDELRFTIKQLEQGIEIKTAEATQKRQDFERTVAEIADADQAVQVYRSALTAARQELNEAEIEEAAAERADHIQSDIASLVKSFTRIASDKPWFIGTGQDDPILAHQWQAAQFGAVARRWILGDGPGLGKTRSVIAWLDLIRAKKVLIVCEPNVVEQFEGEVLTLAPHRKVVSLYKRTPKQKHEILDTLGEAAVVMVNFEVWRRDHDIIAKLLDWEIDTVIVDEAHNLKTTSTSNFKLVKTIIAADNVCPNCGGHIYGLYDPEKLKMAPSRKVPQPCPTCGWKVNMKQHGFDTLMSSRSVKNLALTTGTPILNDPLDLFSLLTLVNPILFPTKADFKRNYLLNNVHTDKLEWRGGAMTKLKPMLADIFLARTLDDAGIELPPQHINVWPVPLSQSEYPLQYRTIKQISETAQIILDSGEEASIMETMSLITRKRQASVCPSGIVIRDTRPDSPTYGEILLDVGTEVTESVKLDVIQERILHYRSEGRVQIVFSQFKTALSEFEKRLTAAGVRVARFDGDTPDKLRLEIKHNLNRANGEPPKWDVVLANYRTGGTGLTFTAVTVTHILDEEWGPGKRDQAYHRTRRIGQPDETLVWVYRIPGSIDTWMSNTIKRKENIIDGFNEGMQSQELTETFLEGLQNGSIL
jgi:SNF2 family DNA or RNA helicase